jgi:hypothetical protein
MLYLLSLDTEATSEGTVISEKISLINVDSRKYIFVA